MPKADSTSNTSRRALLGAAAALPLAALPAIADPSGRLPVLRQVDFNAYGAAPLPVEHPDAELIRLCGRLVAVDAEEQVLVGTDPHAPDEGPNHAYYEALWVARERLIAAVENAGRPATAAGAKALARAALAIAFRDNDGELMSLSHGHRMQLTVTEWIAGETA